MKRHQNKYMFFSVLFSWFVVSLFLVTTLMAQDKAEKKTTDELVVEDSTGEKLAEEETVGKQKKRDSSYVIQVTAQKRKQSIQDVPGSVSALNVKQIEDAKIESTNEIHNYVPNFSSFDFGTGFSYYSIRGQNNAVQYSSSVGIYVDDVPSVQSGNISDSGLYEIERIEVLRGAQGNLYGLNSAGGVINIITKKPDNFWIASGTGSYGNYNMRGYSASVSGPVVKDNLYMGFCGMYNVQDSFMEEEVADTQKRIIMSGRYQVRWTPVKELDILFTVNMDNRDQDYGTFSINDSDPYRLLYKGMTEKNDNKGDRESLRIKYYAPWFEIISVTGRAANRYECDQSLDLMSGGANLKFMSANEKAVSWIEELRLNSIDKKSPLQWIAGVFYHNTGSESDCNMPTDRSWTPPPYNGPAGVYLDDVTESEIKGNTASVFGQAGYTFFERLTLTGGIRYDYDHKEIDYYHNKYGDIAGDFEDSKQVHVFSPRVSLDFRAHESVMTYISAARGYKAGGYSPLHGDSVEAASFDPEYSWTFEGGIKTNWLGNRIIANIAGFFSIVDDIQVMYFDPATYAVSFRNAAKAHTAGVEIETMARPFTGFEIMASFGFLFSEFKEHEIKEAEGNKVPFAPVCQSGLAVQYTSPLGLFARGEGNWNGKTYFNPENKLKQDSYLLLNAKLGYKSENFNCSFFIKNALDKEYYTMIVNWGPGVEAGSLGAPRTFGVEATLEF